MPWRDPLSALCLLLVIIGSVWREIWPHPLADGLAVVGLTAYVLMQGWAVRGSGRAILALAGLAALLTPFFHPQAMDVLRRAAIDAAALIGLFTSLGFLREAAETSPLIQRAGDMMVRQPAGRRYMVLALGSHLISLVLNFGVLPLLGTMVVRGNTPQAAGGDERIVRIRTQRMLSAVLRGFTAMTVWSPLSVSFVVTQTVVHGVDWKHLLPVQIGLTILFMGLGWLLDRLSFPVVAAPEQRPSWSPMLHLSALVGAVVTLSLLLAEILSLRLVVGAMIVVPLAGVAWLVVQHGSLPSALGHLMRRLGISFPQFRSEVAMLGGAMFLGKIIVAFVSPQQTATLLQSLPLPPTALIILIALLVMGLARFGVSQIVSVTLLGGALTNLDQLHLPPLVLASALMGAWALSASSTPVGAAVLSISRIANVPLKTVANQWNGRYVIFGSLILALWISGLMLLVPS